MAPKMDERKNPYRAPSIISLYKVVPGEELSNFQKEDDDITGSLLSVDIIEAKDGEIPGVVPPNMTFKVKVMHTILIFAAFLGFGFCRGIYGPTLLELRKITGTSLATISMLFSCLGVGGIAGSLTFGRLFDRFNPLFLIIAAVSALSTITAVIPWMNKILVMMIVCGIHSFVYSGLAIGCNVTLFRLWRERSRPIFLGMHLLYTVGGFIAPLLSEPFLSSRSSLYSLCIKNHTQFPESSTNHNNSSSYITNNQLSVNRPYERPHSYNRSTTIPLHKPMSVETVELNYPQHAQNLTQGAHFHGNNHAEDFINDLDITSVSDSDSKIFITYLIVSLYLIIVAISFFILMVYMKNKKSGIYWRDYRPSEGLPCKGGASLYRLIATILFMMFNSHIGGQETLYTGLLFTFAVEQVGFTQTLGSLLVSMFFTSYAIGRFCSIFIGQWVPNPAFILTFNVAGTLTASCVLAYFTTTNVIVLWICTVLQGLCLSTMYTMGLLWAKEFVPITASFTSLYTIAFTFGMMVWPPLTSSLMKKMGPGWFAYMNVIIAVGYGTALILLAVLHRLRFRFKDLSPTQDEDIEVKVQTKIDILAQSVHSVSTM